jgi:hypothetical protein
MLEWRARWNQAALATGGLTAIAVDGKRAAREF